jgi:hypothetical protein
LAWRCGLHIWPRRVFAATGISGSARGGWALGAIVSAATPPAYGFTADYPNDFWDMNLIYKRIGKTSILRSASCRAGPCN